MFLPYCVCSSTHNDSIYLSLFLFFGLKFFHSVTKSIFSSRYLMSHSVQRWQRLSPTPLLLLGTSLAVNGSFLSHWPASASDAIPLSSCHYLCLSLSLSLSLPSPARAYHTSKSRYPWNISFLSLNFHHIDGETIKLMCNLCTAPKQTPWRKRIARARRHCHLLRH